MTIIGILFVFSLFLLFYMYGLANQNNVKYHKLFFPDFPEEFGEVNLFFISDIHKRKISDELIAQIKGKIDMVIIGGDIVEQGVPLTRVKENIEQLKKIGQIFFVWGNNDYEVNFHDLDALLLENGVKILDNTAVAFETTTGEKMFILGVDDVGQKRDRLDLALEDARGDGFKMLVSHNPIIASKVKCEHKIPLILSGHTHGGQIRIMGYGRYKLGGYERLKNTSILISNGYGTTGVPLRLGAKSETHIITLGNKSHS